MDKEDENRLAGDKLRDGVELNLNQRRLLKPPATKNTKPAGRV